MRTEIITTPARSRLMARVRQKGTSAELAVRIILDDLGIIYETNVPDLPGSPDLVSKENKWAIFVHGCYWHAHEDCTRWKLPIRNRDFWEDKFKNNRERDRRKITLLKNDGFSIMVVWECELEDNKKVRKRLQDFFSVNESYRFSDTKKSVSRVIISRNGITQSTRLYFKNIDVAELDARSAFDLAFLRHQRPPDYRKFEAIVRSVDLFSGCGGLSLGAMEACRAIGKRFVSVAAVDNDSSALDVYKKNIEYQNAFCENITELVNGELGTDITENERKFLNKISSVELLLAGPPCKGYSDLNNHTRRNDPRNAMYQRVTRFIEIVRPKHVLVENVPSVVHGKDGEVKEAIEVMNQLNYHVDSAIVDLSLIGVPQKRKRHILIGSTTKTFSIKEIIEKNKVDEKRSLNWAIMDLIDVNPISLFDTPTQHSKANQERIKYLHDNNVYDLPDPLRPVCHQDGKHSYKSMYGRMKSDEPAQTITSGFRSPGQGRFIHPTLLRTITPHEAARIQLFPDYFNFDTVTKKTSLAEMIGNAVPYKLSYIFNIEFLS